MNATTVHHVSLLTPSVTPFNPRGAQVAARLFLRLCRTVAQTFVGSRPVPSAAAASTRADEAQEVRAMAWQVERTDPGFAADLYAAAARHEGLPA